MSIRLVPITIKNFIRCPKCAIPLLELSQAQMKVVSPNEYFLKDGDTVFISNSLSREQKTPDGYWGSLLVGDCMTCGFDYFVITADMMNCEMKIAEPYLTFNAPMDIKAMHHCFGDGKKSARFSDKWFLTEYQTEVGIMHNHTFGPWRIPEGDKDEFVGEYGVCSCSNGSDIWNEAKDLLLFYWDDLRKVLLSRQ